MVLYPQTARFVCAEKRAVLLPVEIVRTFFRNSAVIDHGQMKCPRKTLNVSVVRMKNSNPKTRKNTPALNKRIKFLGPTENPIEIQLFLISSNDKIHVEKSL